MTFPKESPGKGWVIAVLVFIVTALCLQITAVFVPRWFSIDCYGNNNHFDVGLWYICINNTGFQKFENCIPLANVPGWDVPVWLYSCQMMQSVGSVSCFITALLTFGYLLTPMSLLLSAASGLAAASLCSASFIVIGALNLSVGRRSMTDLLIKLGMNCEVHGADFSKSFILSMTAVAILTVAGLVTLIGSAILSCSQLTGAELICSKVRKECKDKQTDEVDSKLSKNTKKTK